MRGFLIISRLMSISVNGCWVQMPSLSFELIYLEQGKHVFIPAHGNSLRAIIMYLDGLSEDEVVKLELATGDPIVYDYTESAFSRCPIA